MQSKATAKQKIVFNFFFRSDLLNGIIVLYWQSVTVSHQFRKTPPTYGFFYCLVYRLWH